MRDIKRTFNSVINIDEIQSEISTIIDLLEEVMSVMINIFDRRDSYKDNADFSQYIATMLSKGKPQMVDPRLSRAVLALQQTIHKNVVLHHYSIVWKFRVFVFSYVPMIWPNFIMKYRIWMTTKR